MCSAFIRGTCKILSIIRFVDVLCEYSVVTRQSIPKYHRVIVMHIITLKITLYEERHSVCTVPLTAYRTRAIASAIFVRFFFFIVFVFVPFVLIMLLSKYSHANAATENISFCEPNFRDSLYDFFVLFVFFYSLFFFIFAPFFILVLCLLRSFTVLLV